MIEWSNKDNIYCITLLYCFTIDWTYFFSRGLRVDLYGSSKISSMIYSDVNHPAFCRIFLNWGFLPPFFLYNSTCKTCWMIDDSTLNVLSWEIFHMGVFIVILWLLCRISHLHGRSSLSTLNRKFTIFNLVVWHLFFIIKPPQCMFKAIYLRAINKHSIWPTWHGIIRICCHPRVFYVSSPRTLCPFILMLLPHTLWPSYCHSTLCLVNNHYNFIVVSFYHKH